MTDMRPRETTPIRGYGLRQPKPSGCGPAVWMCFGWCTAGIAWTLYHCVRAWWVG